MFADCSSSFFFVCVFRSGKCSVWNIENCTQERAWAAHEERANTVLFHPTARSADSHALELATASVDETIKLWSAADGR